MPSGQIILLFRLCQLAQTLTCAPDVVYSCMYGQLHCVGKWALFSVCVSSLSNPILRGCLWGECWHWSLCLIWSQPDRAAQEANYPLVLLQQQWVTACAELTAGVLARAVSLQSLLFSSARCCAEALCVLSMLIHFLSNGLPSALAFGFSAG